MVVGGLNMFSNLLSEGLGKAAAPTVVKCPLYSCQIEKIQGEVSKKSVFSHLTPVSCHTEKIQREVQI